MKRIMNYVGPLLGCIALYAIAYAIGKAAFYLLH